MNDNIQQLLEIDFKKAGSWEIRNDFIYPKIHSFASESPALYAFVVKEEVKYIGKTSRRLIERLNNYRKPEESQKTNIRNNAHIIENLSNGADVLIYILINNDMEYKGYKLSLPAALEDSIIKAIQPEWNVRK